MVKKGRAKVAVQWREIKTLYGVLNIPIRRQKVKWPKGTARQYERELARLRAITLKKKLVKKDIRPKRKGRVNAAAVWRKIKVLYKKLNVPKRQQKVKWPRGTLAAYKKELGRLEDLKLKISRERVRARHERLEISRKAALERARKASEARRIRGRTLRYVFTGEKYKPTSIKIDLEDALLVRELVKDSGIQSNVRVLLFLDEEQVTSVIYKNPSSKTDKRNMVRNWMESGETGIDDETVFETVAENADLDDFGRMVLIVQPESELTGTDIAQRFLDGKVDHCVIAPIRRWAVEKRGEGKSNSKRARQMYDRKIKKCDEYKEKYSEGMTIEEIQTFCDDVQINIVILDVFAVDNKGSRRFNINSTRPSRKTFKFVNTRIDHLDLSIVVAQKERKELNEYEMKRIMVELKDKGAAPLYCMNNAGDYVWISTIDECYKLKSKTGEAFDKFYTYLEETCKVNGKQLNISYDEPHSRLVRAAVHQCGQIHFSDPDDTSMDDGEEYVRIDQEKAYASFKRCSYYQGFVVAFSSFKRVITYEPREFLKKHLGIYMVENIDVSGSPYRGILEKMNMYHNRRKDEYKKTFAATSPELIFMLDIGITFYITFGCWSTTSFDFEFPDFMYEREAGKPRYYQKMVGVWNSVNEYNTISMDGNQRWGSHVKSLGYDTTFHPDCYDSKENDDDVKEGITTKENSPEGEQYDTNEVDESDEDEDISQMDENPLWRKETIAVRVKQEESCIKTPMSAFLTGYQRGSLMQQVFEINPNDNASEVDEVDASDESDEDDISKMDDDDSHPLWRKGTITVTFKQEERYIKHKNHMAAFIDGYQRISLMQQVFEIDQDDIISIICDEVVVRKGSEFKVLDGFREKNSELDYTRYETAGFLSYYNHKVNEPKKLFLSFEDEDSSVIVHIGPGGSGKTHSAITDEGYLRALYICPSHKLRENKATEYKDRGIRTEAIYNILNYPRLSDYQYGLERKNVFIPSVIIWDEITSSTQKEFNKARKLYPFAQFILCGDCDRSGFSYQLTSICGDPIDISGFMIKEHTHNRRAKCPKLRKLLSWFRQGMLEDYGIAEDGAYKRPSRKAIEKLKEEIKKRVQCVSVEEVKKLYDIEDYILVGTRDTDVTDADVARIKELRAEKSKKWKNIRAIKDLKQRLGRDAGCRFWTDTLRDKGYKYLVVKKTKEHFNGTVVIGEEQTTKSYEERHAFTSHQIQGETVRKKIFIDLNDLFDVHRMLYVGLSRAEYLDQLYIVDRDSDI